MQTQKKTIMIKKMMINVMKSVITGKMSKREAIMKLTKLKYMMTMQKKKK